MILDVMRPMIEKYSQDNSGLERSYKIPMSKLKYQKTKKYFMEWQVKLSEVDFNSLDQSEKVDYILFKNKLKYELEILEIEEIKNAELAPLLPFASLIVKLMEECRLMEPVQPAAATQMLVEIKALLLNTINDLDAIIKSVKITIVGRAIHNSEKLKAGLEHWFKFYDGYDPEFSWWCSTPFSELGPIFDDFQAQLKKVLDPEDAGINAPVIGDSIGREALINEIKSSMIPYSPEELLEIGKKELDWCHQQLKIAAAELGYDDWHDGLEHVKKMYVAPGQQPQMVKDMADEAIDFMEANDLVSVPEIVKDLWRMEMMTADEQKVSPFFLGGEIIKVSFPTSEMTESEKQMSLRGNNPHFARAVVHHELIPGHHLQLFSLTRNNPHRQTFITPFWVEGWPLHWEMLLWEMGFPTTPENKIGMLFWRSHRAARIVFSLSFHLEKMTPQECIDMLIEDVGHEPDNAIAEVRRSFNGWYPPLYQAAYMLGGLQIHQMYAELVRSGKMTNREFHDRIMQENCMPIEMLRALIEELPVTADYQSSWRFYQERGTSNK